MSVKYKFRWFLLAVGVAGISAGLGMVAVILFQVYYGDVSSLKKTTILAKIREETTIYTLDEKTRIGSFFDSSHRRYVPIDEIPPDMINAMIASEDKNFYHHIGVDPLAIMGAFFEGVTSGFRFRRGGSSITQQTVKNILDRWDPTFKRKFQELISALQLERMYSKQQILEFYLNQFHVTANGNGVGIAARYYFDKDVRDLSLVESAFIAGSVKGPSKYNPFIKNSKQAAELAKENANERKNYVIRRMYEQNWITKAQYEEALAAEIPFNKGKFRTREVALVSLIRSQLNKKEILSTLGLDDVSDVNHAGLKVYTTIDAELQHQAQLMTRRNLSRVETILRGFAPESQEDYSDLRTLEVNQYYFGRVKKVHKKKVRPFIELDFGLPQGVIPYESLVRYAKQLSLPTYRPYQQHLKEMLDSVKEGDILFVEVMEYNEVEHTAICELQKKPIVNGGMIAIDQGEVRAVVSGFDAKGYNRAISATRQPGSVFKSLVYMAGIQLGWSIIDKLDNEDRVFPFQGKFYYPRHDHVSPYSEVSMLWAGTKSENLASVYLTAHLTDKLNFEQFKGLMAHMGLSPEEGETARDFHYRVAKETGVQLDNDGVKEHLLRESIEDVIPDLVFSGEQKVRRRLAKLWWGRGYAAELQNLYTASGEDLSNDERGRRISLIRNNFKRMAALAQASMEDWAAVGAAVARIGAEGVMISQEVAPVLSRFRVLSGSGGKPSLGYFKDFPEEEPPELTEEGVVINLESVPGRTLNLLDVQAIWGESGFFGESAGIKSEDVKLDGYLDLKIFSKIQAGLEQRFESLKMQQDPYDLVKYYNHHDFKVILGLQYLVKLTRLMGVYSNIEPVLSFPLGTNDVSVAEVAKIYQTLMNGKTYKFYDEGPNNQLNFIRRIEDRHGNILFEPEKKVSALFGTCQASQMGEILKKVITHGTGRFARGELYVSLEELKGRKGSEEEQGIRIRVPAFGKTGTTNDYRTAYFAGFLPVPRLHRAPLDPMSGLAIASYVGYDFNQIMRNGAYKVSGAYGALPVWTNFAKAMIEHGRYKEYIDTLDLNLISRRIWPMKTSECGTLVKLDLPRGSILGSAEDDREVFATTDFNTEGESFIDEFARDASVRSVVSLATDEREGRKVARRFFEPFRNPVTDEEKADGAGIIVEPSPIEPKLRSNPQIPSGEVGVEADEASDARSLERANEANSGENSRSQVKPPAVPVEKAGSKKPGSVNPDPGFTEEELW